MTKRSFIRFLFTFICVFALACVLMPGPAKADTVTYITRSWNSTAVNSTEATRNDVIPFPESQEIAPGWYYVNRNLTINGRVCLQGDTQIILGDGFTLNVKGLYIPSECTLTIYAQSNGENAGKLISKPSGGAAIGGYSGHDNGNIVIHGGTVQATGASHCAGIGTNDGKTGGSITIYGGTITAKGGEDGAAIGGGRYCDGGTITIYGGNITANGPTDSDTWEDVAGIGGGYKGAGGTINIYGGTITTYSRDGAGIGGGDDGAGGTITIYGGTITSTKVNQGQGARIGGGCDGKPGTIVINGGKITANGGSGAGIGGGKGNKSGGSVTINGGDITTTGDYGIGKGEDGAAVTVTLDYTDVTKDTLSITASSFKGSVTVKRPFVNGNSVFYPGTIKQGAVQNGYLANSALTAWDELPTTWSMMQHAMDQVLSAGRTIRLGADLTAGPGEITLKVNTGYNFTIDLNGHTINRNLVAEANDASVIFVDEGGTLTITDSAGGGVITGGFATDGGGIYNKGTLTIRGGTIRNNTATNSGGGIHNLGTLTIAGGTICENKAMQAGGGINNSGTVTLTGGEIRGNAGTANGGGVYNTGTMTMTGGSITNNGAALYHGGGIFNSGTLNLKGGIISENSAAGRLGGQGGGVLNNGTLKIAGAPVVRDNIALTGDDIFLRTGHPTMTVTGALTEGADLSVYAERGTGAVTSGYSTHNSAAPDSFFSVTEAHCVIELENGEAVFNRYYEVSVINLDATVDKDLAQEGETVTVTLNTLPEEGTSVRYRYYNGDFKTETAAPGADNTFTIKMPASSVTVYCEMTWADLTRIIDDTCARYGSVTIKLPNNITAAEGDAALHITNFSAVTLDLNGCRLDRGLAGKEESDSAFRIDMYGRLNIMDTCPETPGGITGANGAPAVLVGTGYLTLDGGNIYNNTTTAGAAVYVNNGGSFTMNGGTISGNHAEVGAGVYVNEKGSFTMNGGAIIANEAQMGAGVLSFGTFTLKNGEISANRATGMIDNNTPYAGGGAAILQGEFNMQGGEIRENSATGYGGGLLLGEGTSRISGGTIGYNTSTMHGSGVCNLANAMTMTSGHIIGNTVTAPSSVTATYGAGVVIMSEASLTVSGTPTIQGNAYNKDGYYSLQCDVLLSPGNVIQMNGPLTDSTRLYVWPGVPGKAVTRGLKAYGGTDPLNIIRLNASQQQQESEHPFHIMLDADGEAVLGWKWKVLYQDEHSGQESEQPVVMGMEAYELLPNMFGALNGEYFYGWEIDGKQYVPGNRIAIPEVPTTQMETDFIRIQAVWGGEYYTVSFDKGAEDAGGRMPEVRTAQDEPYTLPKCDFTAPEHKVFDGWLVGDATEPLAAGTEVTLNGDTLLTAAWRWETIGVSFDPNGGTGSMDGTEMDYGTEYVLPACGFTAPDGLYFGGWLINGDPAVLYPGETITVTGETTAKPRWSGLWGHLQVQLRTMEGSSLTLTLPGNATAESGDIALLIPEGKTVVLDLNGHTLNRGNPASGDCVIQDLGTLTIRDSSEGKTGTITGGTNGGVVVGLYEVDGEDYLHSIVKSGSLILASGTISGNSRNSARGGGVALVQGTFTMTGGEISGNSAREGGGVHIDTQNGYQTSRFTMSGGRIRNNTANYTWGGSGGGLKGENAEIILSGGEISGNTVIGDNGRGGGVAIEQSTLTLSGCRITGNSAGQNGGGISAEGRYYEGVLDEPSTIVMTGGEIIGNSAFFCGGGIYAESNVSVTVSGGRITGNTSDTRLHGGGILQGVNTRIILSGSPVITGNKAGGETDNINLAYEAISINGDLSEDALVGVAIDPEESTLPEDNGGIAVTSGLPGRGSAANFISDDSGLTIGLNADGEAVLGAAVTVSFAPGDENAEGEMESFTTATGSAYPLPECAYTLEDNSFKAWSVAIGTAEPETREPGEIILITADTTITAAWKDIAASPVFSPVGGTYAEAQEVAISCETEDAIIYYTTDGTVPTAESTEYTTPVSIAVSTVLKAIAVREDMTDSPVAEAEFTITHKVEVFAGEGMTRVEDYGEDEQTGISGQMADVVFTANDGYYFPADYGIEPLNGISVTRDNLAQITVSGAPTADTEIMLPDAAGRPAAPTEPTATGCTNFDNNDGTLTGITVDMEYQIVGAEAWIRGTGETVTGLEPGAYLIRYRATDEAIASEALILVIVAYTAPDETAMPVFTPEEGNYYGTLEVSIACATEGAVIRYTTDGSEPDADCPAYTEPIRLCPGDWTVRAVAMANGAPDSEITTAVYHIGYIPCGGEIRVRKVLSGRDWTAKDVFEFTVEKSGDAPVTEKGTVAVTDESGDHTESFGNLTFTRPGTYSWTITETHQGETIRGVRYAEAGQTVTITVRDDGNGKLIADQGVELTQTVTFTNTYEPEAFGDATFTLPSGARTVEANAFEGDTLISVVDAGNCETIGAYAFSGCTGLTKIRLPINCTIGEHAFDGCTALYAIYGPAGGSTQDWAEDHDILFIGE